ncbi:MAG TPA: hypothetical protein VFZ67_02570 [Nitrososphaera sp.]
MNKRQEAVIIMLALFALIIVYSQPGTLLTHAQEGNGNSNSVSIFPPDAEPYGLTYGEWTTKWWQWIYSMPEEHNPAIDDTGENCANNQSGPVWFLAGTFGGAVTRECTIPPGKAILYPIMNVECDSATDPTLDTESELRSCAKADQDTVITKEITIDGINISNLDNYRFQSRLFNLTFPENNIAGIAPQIAKAVSDGYWILLEPLPPGTHEIHSRAALGDPTAIGTTNFALDVTYLLTVAEAQIEVAPTQNGTNQSITLQGSSGNSTLE